MGVLAMASLIIPNGGTESNVLEFDENAALNGIMIYGPGTLTGDVTVYVFAPGVARTEGNRRKLKSAGDPVTFLIANAADAEPLEYQGWSALQLVSSAVEGAAREFRVSGDISRWRSA